MIIGLVNKYLVTILDFEIFSLMLILVLDLIISKMKDFDIFPIIDITKVFVPKYQKLVGTKRAI